MDPVTTLRPGERLGDFEVVRQLGRGGMGVVYLVRDERLGRQVALKVIAPELVGNREFQERFEAEARSAAAIEHPNAVPIYSAGASQGNFYIAMRYVEGTDLREYLARNGPLSKAAAATVVAEVGAALDAAHAAGFVHRDVKPANILLTGRPGAGTAFLTDFGLTRSLGTTSTQLTNTGQWIGTLDYVAPEQMAGERIDARTDIYSLGCVLYEMVNGAVPFTGDEMQKLWRKANEEPPPLPADDGSHPFDPVLARAIARDPDRRFHSAGDLGRAAMAAAGTRTEAPTERSVATGAAAVGLREGASPPARKPPPRHSARDLPTTQMPVLRGGRPPGRRRSAAASVAIVGAAIALGAGLVVGALLLAEGRGGHSSTVVRSTAEATSPEASTSAEPPTSPEPEASAPVSTAPVADEGGTTTFYGSLYSAEIPAGWIQEEDEALASDGSYVENTWNSPDGEEALKIDQSPGEPADPAESAAGIAADLRAAGYTVYSVTDEVELGGLLGSELAFRATSGLPERVDFFFNLGDDGYAVLGSGYDIETARDRVDSLVASIEPVGGAG